LTSTFSSIISNAAITNIYICFYLHHSKAHLKTEPISGAFDANSRHTAPPINVFDILTFINVHNIFNMV